MKVMDKPVAGINHGTGDNPLQDLWNDSLADDYLWSNVNFGEAVTEVMTPLSWTVLKLIFGMWEILPGYDIVGTIGGRPYLNISLFASLFKAIGKGRQDLLDSLEGTLYMNLPEDANIPVLSFSKWSILTILPSIIRTRIKEWLGWVGLPAYLKSNPDWCRTAQERIRKVHTKTELHNLWFGLIYPHVTRSVWNVMGSASASTDYSMRLRRQLTELGGREDAEVLLANVSDQSGPLASLGPLVGIARLAQGEMDRRAYLEQYGHRGPHEFELSVPRPSEDPHWIDAQLAHIAKSPIHLDALLAKQQANFEAAWSRFEARYPNQVNKMQNKIKDAAYRARMRELARSEYVRDRWVIRTFALRAGDLTELEGDIFFLTLDEVLGALSNDETPLPDISARKEAYEQYRALPPYPSIILGPFDPFQWAADPDRRTDFYDSHKNHFDEVLRNGQVNIIQGSPGSAGHVVGKVRLLDRPENGNQLQNGEVLVTTQTDISWTLLFPRASAIVTDVGAPLSHAAIVARELGIPAVVGCGDATMRLSTGDRVRVDGAHGIVEILEE